MSKVDETTRDLDPEFISGVGDMAERTDRGEGGVRARWTVAVPSGCRLKVITMKQHKSILVVAVLATSAGMAIGPATFDTDNIPQPHLAAARDRG
jgi:hypothetical protein